MSNLKSIEKITLISFSKYLRDDLICKRLLFRVGFFLESKKCIGCRKIILMTNALTKDYVMCNYLCKANNFPRHGTILFNSKLSHKTFLLLLNCYYFNNSSVKILTTLIDINRKTVYIFKKKIEDIICRLYDKSIVKLGGKSKVLEIDETLVARRKYNRGCKSGKFGFLE
ncbi:hypothetical protein DMUE_3021 [Dictyocoela muelleri]|nr:hypothetical protein DMUE_3021 [Dictyocoela muelleri]